MKKRTFRLLLALPLLAVVSSPAAAAPIAVSPDVHTDVVTSMAASSRVYRPAELPLTGRNCADVLDDLRGRAGFLGEIRSIYPSTDANTCYKVEGRQEQVAVVCCAPPNRGRDASPSF
jgi:hypothetical protein